VDDEQRQTMDGLKLVKDRLISLHVGTATAGLEEFLREVNGWESSPLS